MDAVKTKLHIIVVNVRWVQKNFLNFNRGNEIFNFLIPFFHLQLEVFDVLFIREQEKRHVVHCMGCARKQSPSLQGFVCLEEYRLSELSQVYNAFELHNPPALPEQVTKEQSLPKDQQSKQSKQTTAQKVSQIIDEKSESKSLSPIVS